VTAHPTADWIAQQITEAFPWEEAPRYLIRDRDAVYGAVVTRRLRAMGIRDKPISAGSPWQNCFAETTDRHAPAGVRRPIMGPGFTTHSAKTRHSIERSSASVASLHDPFSVAFITNIAEFDLRHTG
jgi:hypothetical protein